MGGGSRGNVPVRIRKKAPILVAGSQAARLRKRYAGVRI